MKCVLCYSEYEDAYPQLFMDEHAYKVHSTILFQRYCGECIVYVTNQVVFSLSGEPLGVVLRKEMLGPVKVESGLRGILDATKAINLRSTPTMTVGSMFYPVLKDPPASYGSGVNVDPSYHMP